MTKLTNHTREAIAYRIMGDLPSVDYDAPMQARVTEICVASFPAALQKLWADPEMRGYFRTGTHYYCCVTFTTPGYHRGDDVINALIAADAPLAELHRLRDEQRDTRMALRDKIRVSLASCSTEKQFRERFPDLASYLPAPQAQTNLPATTDLVDSLRAAGLPSLEAA